MALAKIKKEVYIIMIDSILIFLMAVFHFVSYFLIKKSDFNEIFDIYDSSPLFNFGLSDERCTSTYNVVFHVWGGVKDTLWKRRTRYTIRKDAKNIEILKDKYFCYKSISYRELLYNGQIKKVGETPSGEYTKNCGIIDTLGQHLFIKNGEDCPLYEVNINENGIDLNEHDSEKKIVGKLILNDGQPCYKSNEKLWKKFSDDEYADEHLTCEVEIFGKSTDDRYINRGSVTYDEIYEQNLSPNYYNLLKSKLGNNKVSLYSREFLGIDKKCDQESSITRKKSDELSHNQEKLRLFYLIEGIINLFFFLGLLVFFIVWLCNKKKGEWIRTLDRYILLTESVIITFGFLIREAVYLHRIKKYNISYQCSDDKTNELFKKENENTEKSILYTWINLGLDILVIVANAIILTIGILRDKGIICDDEKYLPKNVDRGSENVDINANKKQFGSNYTIREKFREVIVDNNNNNFNNNVNNNVNNNHNNNNDTNY